MHVEPKAKNDWEEAIDQVVPDAGNRRRRSARMYLLRLRTIWATTGLVREEGFPELGAEGPASWDE